MNRIFFTIAVAAFLSTSFMFTSCQDAPTADDAQTTTAQEVPNASGETYKADIAQSKLEWVGTKPTGRHHGTFKIQDGALMVANNNITGGNFTIDMATVTPDDQEADGNAKLQGHLKSGDFFETDKFPTATFEITNVTAGVTGDTGTLVMKDATHMVTGNLMLKGVSKSITFPAKVTMSGNQVMADANFNMDRTNWGLNYRSDASLGDKFINNIVNIQLHLVANK